MTNPRLEERRRMRQHLKSVPVFQKIGNLPVRTADQMVATGSAQSIRGQALLLLDHASIEEFVSELELDPATAADVISIIARAQSEERARRLREAGIAAYEGPEVGL
jgi:hypothetical protein